MTITLGSKWKHLYQRDVYVVSSVDFDTGEIWVRNDEGFQKWHLIQFQQLFVPFP